MDKLNIFSLIIISSNSYLWYNYKHPQNSIRSSYHVRFSTMPKFQLAEEYSDHKGHRVETAHLFTRLCRSAVPGLKRSLGWSENMTTAIQQLNTLQCTYLLSYNATNLRLRCCIWDQSPRLFLRRCAKLSRSVHLRSCTFEWRARWQGSTGCSSGLWSLWKPIV